MEQSQQLNLFDTVTTSIPRYFCFDTETGGFDEKVNGLASIAVVLLDENLVEVDRYYTVIYEPDKVYDKGALDVNGFTLEELRRDGRPISEVVERLKEMLPGTIPVAHNLQFDARWLNRLGFDLQTGICTMEIDWVKYPFQKHKLGLVYARAFGKPMEDAHNSLADILATIEVLKWQSGRDKSVLEAKPINWDRFKR